MDAKEASNESLNASKGLSQAAIDLLNSHMILLSIEFEEAKRFYWQCFIRMAILVVFGMLFLVFSSIGIVVYFWETHRMFTIGCLSLVCFLLMITAGLSLLYLRKKTKLFSATKEELIKDKVIFYES